MSTSALTRVASPAAPGIALVTGASSGIGRELARLLAARQHPLVLVGRNQARLEQVAATIRAEHGVRVWTHVLDLGVAGAARQLVERTRADGLTIDILINNAGVGLYGEHADIPTERVDQMLQLNIATLSELCMLYGAEMKARGAGRILNVASTAAYQPTPFFAAYGASKAFVLNFSEALAMELADHGVTVSCLSPGPTDTGFFAEIEARGVSSAHFDRAARHDARTVAQIGLDMLDAGALSRIVGAKNKLRAFSARLAPRAVVARIAKNLMRASAAGHPAPTPSA
jgi:short-subunit dehydrogenase